MREVELAGRRDDAVARPARELDGAAADDGRAAPDDEDAAVWGGCAAAAADDDGRESQGQRVRQEERVGRDGEAGGEHGGVGEGGVVRDLRGQAGGDGAEELEGAARAVAAGGLGRRDVDGVRADAVADFEARHAGADGVDFACDVEAEDEGVLGWSVDEAEALDGGVGGVDAGGAGFDDDLVGSWGGHGSWFEG